MTRYLFAAVGVLALLLAGTGWLLKGAVEDAAVAQAQRDGYANALQQQNDELARRNTILAARERERAQAQREAASWRRRWKEAQRDDPNCETWSSQPLPGCVVRLFDLPGAGAGRPDAAGRAAATDASP